MLLVAAPAAVDSRFLRQRLRANESFVDAVSLVLQANTRAATAIETAHALRATRLSCVLGILRLAHTHTRTHTSKQPRCC